MTVRVCLCHGAPCRERERDDSVFCPVTKRRLQRWAVIPEARVQPHPSQKIADHPGRMKWCRGCELFRPVTDFGSNGQGYPRARCNPCRRVPERERYRQRYRTNEDFRQSEIERAHRAYWGPEATA